MKAQTVLVVIVSLLTLTLVGAVPKAFPADAEEDDDDDDDDLAPGSSLSSGTQSIASQMMAMAPASSAVDANVITEPEGSAAASSASASGAKGMVASDSIFDMVDSSMVKKRSPGEPAAVAAPAAAPAAVAAPAAAVADAAAAEPKPKKESRVIIPVISKKIVFGSSGQGNDGKVRRKFPRAFCSLEKDTGILCPGVKRGNYVDQFHFDPESNRCHAFVYNGCGGNANRFSSLWECNQDCSKKAKKL